jgi:hypothetical protein
MGLPCGTFGSACCGVVVHGGGQGADARGVVTGTTFFVKGTTLFTKGTTPTVSVRTWVYSFYFFMRNHFK